MIWLGDNIYLREVDWYPAFGILARNTHTRSLPEMQPLLASTHHYAIWDDRLHFTSTTALIFIKGTLETSLFWGNPTMGSTGKRQRLLSV